MKTSVFHLFFSTAVIAIVHVAWASAGSFRGNDGFVLSRRAATHAKVDTDCPSGCKKPWSNAFGSTAAEWWCHSQFPCPPFNTGYNKTTFNPNLPSLKAMDAWNKARAYTPEIKPWFKHLDTGCFFHCFEAFQPLFHEPTSHLGINTTRLDSVRTAQLFCAESYCKGGRTPYQGPIRCKGRGLCPGLVG